MSYALSKLAVSIPVALNVFVVHFNPLISFYLPTRRAREARDLAHLIVAVARGIVQPWVVGRAPYARL